MVNLLTTFYDGIVHMERDIVDTISGGSFMDKYNEDRILCIDWSMLYIQYICYKLHSSLDLFRNDPPATTASKMYVLLHGYV